MMNPFWAKDTGEDRQRFEEAMYAFIELDNLEYAVEKYRLGYMDSTHAARSLRTFKSRCRSSPSFRCLCLHLVPGSGYTATTAEVVHRVCCGFKCDPQEWSRTHALHGVEAAPADEELPQ